ncbi:hypothetical protein K7711_11235 [Nocardia sp. CA2R105]|uniref:SCO6745 family protein n=1 Tax=Nocardia coffeae TaxID=2873381 RepID=UPI001CA69614|nr:hypothetical protein [Nocardia coffeae]MBY8857051.1 hypothetical protein [Nocardia coffeae]
MSETSRRMWELMEPYHAVTYFAPESQHVCEALGAKGFWMGYFALRAAPLGPVPAEVVVATFYNFHPRKVAHAVPAAWEAASPADYLRARRESVSQILHRLLGDEIRSLGLAEAAELARTAALAAPIAGRPLGAANAALDWPSEPHLILWHAQTILRESRGDAHVAALLSGGLDPCEALVIFAADGKVTAERVRTSRSWTEAEWDSATTRLRDRGLLDDSDTLTPDGHALRAWVEDRTDQASQQPWNVLGPTGTERLAELIHPLTRTIANSNAFAEDNPMGLPKPA